MASSIGGVARSAVNTVKARISEDAEGAREAWKSYRSQPSWLSVTRHQLGMGRPGGQKRRTAARKSAGRSSQSRRSNR